MRKPRWWLRHLIVGFVVASCIGLGIWQLARLAERRAFNRELLSHSHEPVAELSSTRLDVRHDAYRRVQATGVFDPAHEVILRARSHDGRAGNDVLTPLRLSETVAVIVDRGWVPLDDLQPPVEGAAPPHGSVTVSGILLPSEPRPRFFGPHDPKTGVLQTIGRLDLERLSEQMAYPVLPLALLEQTQSPPQESLPLVQTLPPPSEGPHLGYAVQWFLFALTAIVVYGAFLRRERYPARSGADAP